MYSTYSAVSVISHSIRFCVQFWHALSHVAIDTFGIMSAELDVSPASNSFDL